MAQKDNQTRVAAPRASIRLDLRSKVPAYLQIVEQVRALAASGGLAPGDQLPTIRNLAGAARIHFNTVARAYRLLDEAGVISTQHGRGTYVVAPPPSARARKARTEALDLVVRDLLEAAARLGCGPDDVQAALSRAAGGTSAKHSGKGPLISPRRQADRDAHPSQRRKSPTPRSRSMRG
jgi:GntR family transcriptional regulator